MQDIPFSAVQYDTEIRRIVPHYDDFFAIICTAVRDHFGAHAVDWLDIGCGTGSTQIYSASHTLCEVIILMDVRFDN